MDELFHYSLETMKSIVEKMDTTSKARMYDQLYAMIDAYEQQKSKLGAAERRVERLQKKYEALKKQLKKQ